MVVCEGRRRGTGSLSQGVYIPGAAWEQGGAAPAAGVLRAVSPVRAWHPTRGRSRRSRLERRGWERRGLKRFIKWTRLDSLPSRVPASARSSPSRRRAALVDTSSLLPYRHLRSCHGGVGCGGVACTSSGRLTASLQELIVSGGCEIHNSCAPHLI